MAFIPGEVRFPNGRSWYETQSEEGRTRTYVGTEAGIEALLPAYGAAHPDEANLKVADISTVPLVSGGGWMQATVKYTYPRLHGVNEEYDLVGVQVPTSMDTAGNPLPNEVMVFEPAIQYRKVVRMTPLLTVTSIKACIGKTNNAIWNNGAVGEWLFAGAVAREIREDLWEVNYTFMYKEDPPGWRAISTNWSSMTKAYSTVYGSSDFTTMPGI